VCSLVWLNGQSDTELCATSVTVMELRSGVERLAEGKRKADLWEVLDFTLSRLVGSRILFFDVAAASEAARIAAVADAAGTPMGQSDAEFFKLGNVNVAGVCHSAQRQADAKFTFV